MVKQIAKEVFEENKPEEVEQEVVTIIAINEVHEKKLNAS